MTKADIVQRLLDEQHITAEEAVVLLSGVKLELEQTYPTYHPNPWFGIFPPTVPNPYTITATDINQVKKEK
jgi:hypothetical protein